MIATFSAITCKGGTQKPAHRVTELHTALEKKHKIGHVGSVWLHPEILSWNNDTVPKDTLQPPRRTDDSTLLPDSVHMGTL